MWILILMLVGRDGHPMQVESIAEPFATYDACNFAGVMARTLPVLTPSGGTGRVDWVCVSTGATPPDHSSLEARERLREEVRAVIRKNSPARADAGKETK